MDLPAPGAIDRRQFLRGTGLALAAVGVGGAGRPLGARSEPPDWQEVRRQFALSEDHVHLSALLIVSHPRPVAAAIERHRRELDGHPVLALQDNRRRQDEARAAAARYLGARPQDVALTESTTMGLGLVYNGLRLREGQECLTTEHDYYVTHESLRLAAERTGAAVRRVPLYATTAAQATADEIVGAIAGAIRPATRLVALTWVHSGTGLKLPLGRIAQAVARANRGRDEGDRVLLGVDGVHGFGVEDVTMDDLGVDFFIAGCHKWLFGPRGTGVVWARRPAWAALRPTIPSFIDDGTWEAWLQSETAEGPTTAAAMSPGGFKAFEHQWAMTEAFEFHRRLGKARVAARTHALARRLKDGLAEMAHVSLHTPRAGALSAGIVCFDVARLGPWQAVERLRQRGIIATVTPYAARHVRLTPSIYNTEAEIDRALREIEELA